MRRLKKKLYFGLCAATFAVLALVRYTMQPHPQPLSEERGEDTLASPERSLPSPRSNRKSGVSDWGACDGVWVGGEALPAFKPHPIRSVPSYNVAFPDVQDVQIQAARRWGVRPVKSRRQAEERKSELVYVGCNPFFDIDPAMRSSIPYLVPRASTLLQTIGQNFLDSLYVKGVPLHKIIVTSVLRT